MKALEVRINSVMAERRKSQMQTLGAKNEFSTNNNVTHRNHRSSTASIPISDVFQNGQVNRAYEDDELSSRVSIARSQANWKGSNSRM